MAFITILLSLSCVGLSVAKDVLYPDGLGILNNDFQNHVTPQPHTITKWWAPSDGVPKQCLLYAVTQRSNTNPEFRCQPEDLDVWDASYPDCSAAWTFCRCNTSPVSEQQMMTEFGRLPVGVRNNVRNVVTLPDDSANGGSGLAVGPDVIFFANGTAAVANPTVFLHETGHAVDYVQGGLSSTAAWADAVNADTCWPDYYARDNGEASPPNLVEPWAQAFVIKRYLAEVGPLPDGKSTACMANQLAVIGSQTDSLLAATTCNLNTKVPPDTVIPKVWPPTGPIRRSVSEHALEPLVPEATPLPW